jgi:hypothetical protein
MLVLGVVVLVVVAVVLVVVTRRSDDAPTRIGEPAPGPTDLHTRVRSWVDAGLIDDVQAAAIEAHETAAAAAASTTSAAPAGADATGTAGAPTSGPVPAAATTHARSPGPVIEALGYLGGVLASTGVLLLVANAWDELATGGRLALSGLTAVALVGAGAAVPEARAAAMRRLRAVLWTLATAAVGVFAAVAGREVLGSEVHDGWLVAWTAAAIAATSAAMWAGRRRPVQHLIALVALTVAVGAAAMAGFGQVAAGLTVWVVGAALVAAGLRRLSVAPVLEVLVGSLAMTVGSVLTVADDPGIRLLFVVATGVVLVAVVLDRRWVQDTATIVVLAVVGSFTILQGLPALVGTMAEHAAVATGAVCWFASAGVLLVGITRRTRVPVVLEVLGALGLLVGAAVMGVQEPGIATIAGLLTALGLLAASLVPGRIALSPCGAVGLLVYVPWTIAWYFPGEGRVPLLISVSGVLIVGVAVLMARSGGRFRRELARAGDPPVS